MNTRAPRLENVLHVVALFSLVASTSAVGCGASANSGSIEARASVASVGDAHPTGAIGDARPNGCLALAFTAVRPTDEESYLWFAVANKSDQSCEIVEALLERETGVTSGRLVRLSSAVVEPGQYEFGVLTVSDVPPDGRLRIVERLAGGQRRTRAHPIKLDGFLERVAFSADLATMTLYSVLPLKATEGSEPESYLNGLAARTIHASTLPLDSGLFFHAVEAEVPVVLKPGQRVLAELRCADGNRVCCARKALVPFALGPSQYSFPLQVVSAETQGKWLRVVLYNESNSTKPDLQLDRVVWGGDDVTARCRLPQGPLPADRQRYVDDARDLWIPSPWSDGDEQSLELHYHLLAAKRPPAAADGIDRHLAVRLKRGLSLPIGISGGPTLPGCICLNHGGLRPDADEQQLSAAARQAAEFAADVPTYVRGSEVMPAAGFEAIAPCADFIVVAPSQYMRFGDRDAVGEFLRYHDEISLLGVDFITSLVKDAEGRFSTADLRWMCLASLFDGSQGVLFDEVRVSDGAKGPVNQSRRVGPDRGAGAGPPFALASNTVPNMAPRRTIDRAEETSAEETSAEETSARADGGTGDENISPTDFEPIQAWLSSACPVRLASESNQPGIHVSCLALGADALAVRVLNRWCSRASNQTSEPFYAVPRHEVDLRLAIGTTASVPQNVFDLATGERLECDVDDRGDLRIAFPSFSIGRVAIVELNEKSLNRSGIRENSDIASSGIRENSDVVVGATTGPRHGVPKPDAMSPADDRNSDEFRYEEERGGRAERSSASAWTALAAIRETAPPQSRIRPLASPFIRLAAAEVGTAARFELPVRNGSSAPVRLAPMNFTQGSWTVHCDPLELAPQSEGMLRGELVAPTSVGHGGTKVAVFPEDQPNDGLQIFLDARSYVALRVEPAQIDFGAFSGEPCRCRAKVISEPTGAKILSVTDPEALIEYKLSDDDRVVELTPRVEAEGAFHSRLDLRVTFPGASEARTLTVPFSGRRVAVIRAEPARLVVPRSDSPQERVVRLLHAGGSPLSIERVESFDAHVTVSRASGSRASGGERGSEVLNVVIHPGLDEAAVVCAGTSGDGEPFEISVAVRVVGGPATRFEGEPGSSSFAAVAARAEDAVRRLQQYDLPSDTPNWLLFHRLLMFGEHADRSPTFRALWDTLSSPSTERPPPFVRRRRGVAPVLTGGKFDHQHHRDQFLQYMSLAGIALDAKLELPDGGFTPRSLLTTLQWETRDRGELPWSAAALAHYVPPGATWTNKFNERLSLGMLYRALLAEPNLVCGGSHWFHSLACVLSRPEHRADAALDELWPQLDQTVRDEVRMLCLLQRRDGSFSLPKSMENDPRLRDTGEIPRIVGIHYTGHTLEWMAIALTPSELREGWVVRAVSYLTAALNVEYPGLEELLPFDTDERSENYGFVAHAVSALARWHSKVR